jgi:hypothetical protein
VTGDDSGRRLWVRQDLERLRIRRCAAMDNKSILQPERRANLDQCIVCSNMVSVGGSLMCLAKKKNIIVSDSSGAELLCTGFKINANDSLQHEAQKLIVLGIDAMHRVDNKQSDIEVQP